MIKLNTKTNKNNVTKLIDLEIESLNTSLNSQKVLSKQILVFLKSFIGNVEVDSIFSDDISDFLAESSNFLKKINYNLSLYNNLLEILDNIKFNCPTIEYKITVNKISQYNKKYATYLDEIFFNTQEIERFIHSMSSIDISEYISIENLDESINKINNFTEPEEEKKTKKSSTKNKKSVNLQENTLIISETTGLVTLPYKLTDLRKELRTNPDKYSSLSDVVLSKYTKPLSSYKFSAFARFREAYKLIIEREKGTKKDALNLATELFSNLNLHPAIITACKTQNELDVYLSCLEYNELEDFHFFKIVYDAFPVKVKKNKLIENIT